MNNVLQLVGLAKKAGRLEIGEEPVGAAARAKLARVILVASDAAENSARRARHFAEAGDTVWLDVPFTKAELGNTVGRTACAMLAVTDAGLAAAIAKKLTESGEGCTETAEKLGIKAAKVLQRQKEQRIHEKNLREGKKKPWSPPTPAGKVVAGKRPLSKSKANAEAAQARLQMKKIPQGKVVVKGTFPAGLKKAP